MHNLHKLAIIDQYDLLIANDSQNTEKNRLLPPSGAPRARENERKGRVRFNPPHTPREGKALNDSVIKDFFIANLQGSDGDRVAP